MPEVPIVKIYSVKMPFGELVESPKALKVLETFIPKWQAVPQGMWFMTIETLNTTPFIDLTPDRIKELDEALKKGSIE